MDTFEIALDLAILVTLGVTFFVLFKILTRYAELDTQIESLTKHQGLQDALIDNLFRTLGTHDHPYAMAIEHRPDGTHLVHLHPDTLNEDHPCNTSKYASEEPGTSTGASSSDGTPTGTNTNPGAPADPHPQTGTSAPSAPPSTGTPKTGKTGTADTATNSPTTPSMHWPPTQ